uniref:Metallo-beta-lactamase domain-containing protein n=1 Tax=Plectus sambesii TaxID=2011161 RepID=A0A914WN34_9BILA
MRAVILTWIIARCSFAQSAQEPQVIPLIVGFHSESIDSSYVASVTLILDDTISIVVDTPSGTNAVGREGMLTTLINDGQLLPDQVNILVITHGHPDHFGHDMLFTNARHIFFAFEQTDTAFKPLNYQNGVAVLSRNVELWQTPGHTQQDTTVIVKNVPNQGTVAITGDLIFDADDASNPSSTQTDIAWNVESLLLNRNRVLCVADFVVPGHGAMFQVTPQMRQWARCEQVAGSQVPVQQTPRNTGAQLIRPSIFQRQELLGYEN